jgi:hypothetical protein
MNSKMQKDACVGGFGVDAFDAVLADDDDLTRVQLPDEFRLHQIQGTGFRCQHIAAVEFAQAQGAKAVGVLDADHFTPAGEHHHGKGPFSRATVSRASSNPRLQVFDKQVQKHLAVHGGLENGPGILQFILDMMGIDQVAVVGHGIGPVAVAHHSGWALARTELPVVE